MAINWNKWVVRLGFFCLKRRRDGLAFITEAKTKTMSVNVMMPCRSDDKEQMINTARVFYPKIFNEIKQMKKQGWSGVVLQAVTYEDEDGIHFREYFYNLINEYVTLRGDVEWKK